MMQETRTSGNQNIASGVFWKLLENGGDQLITFAISIVLARFLGPERYGTLALMLVFVAIANVIIQTGFQTALIQKRTVDETDYSSVLYLGLILAAVLYAAIFCAAPFAASYFGDTEIAPMLRVLSLILFFGAVISVEIAYISRNMLFRKQCIATVAADLVSGAAGIAAAVCGAGTWALVLQQVGKHFVLMLVLLFCAGFRPGRAFSLRRLKRLFSYGWKVLLSGLIDTVYNNLYTPVISRLYHPVLTGFYNRGNQFPQLIANAMAQSMQAVMLPVFSKTQDETEKMKEMLRSTVKLGSFAMFPMMFGLIAVAPYLIFLLLGEDWMGCVPYLMICAAGYSVWPIHIANLQAINAQGRSDLYLKLEMIKKLLGLLVLVLSVRFGILWMLVFKSLMDFVCTFINAWPNRRLLGYGPLSQWRDVLPEFIAALLMCAGCMLLPSVLRLLFPSLPYAAELSLLGRAGMIGAAAVSKVPGVLVGAVLLLQILSGVLIYVLIASAFRFESFRILKKTAAELSGKRGCGKNAGNASAEKRHGETGNEE